MIVLNTAGLVVVENRKLLLGYSQRKKAWYLPGGKLEPQETPVQGLIREIKEELDIELTETQLKFFTHISAPAYGEPENWMMEQRCYLLSAPLQKATPSAEITGLQFFTSDDYNRQDQQVPGVIKIFEILQDLDLVD